RDAGATRIGVVAGENGGAGPDLADAAGSRDHARERDHVTAVEGQRAVIDDVAPDPAGGAAVAELQRAGRDAGATRIGVVSGDNGGAGPDLADAAGSRDHARERDHVTAVEGQRAVI